MKYFIAAIAIVGLCAVCCTLCCSSAAMACCHTESVEVS